MSDLKTLKDLEWEDGDVSKEEIRAESASFRGAILPLTLRVRFELTYPWRREFSYPEHFFNITVEELKDE